MCTNCNNPKCKCNKAGIESNSKVVCPEKIDAACVIYKRDEEESNLDCISEITAGTSVEQILERWDKDMCETNRLSKDEKVKVDGTDSPGYLLDKITNGDCVVLSTTSQGKLRISLDFNCVCQKLQQINCTTTSVCTPAPAHPVIDATLYSICENQSSVLSVTNTNGTIQWYKNNSVITGATATTYEVANEGGEYYARNTTQCGFSDSDKVTIVYNADCPCTNPVTTPTVTPSSGTVVPSGTINLTATNCNGTLYWYNSSNELVASGNIATVGAGTYFARCTNECGTANSTPVSITVNNSCPSVSAIINKTNPTCISSVLQTNGIIDVVNIANGVQISIDGGSYSALNNLAGTSSHRYTNLAAGSHTIRIKPANSECDATEFTVILNATSCGCDPISALYTVTPSTCTGITPNNNGMISFTNMVNVNRISIATACNANSWSTAFNVSGSTYTINAVVPGTYCVRLYTSETCYSDFNGITVEADCCELELSNPILSC